MLALIPSTAAAGCFSNPSSCGYPDASNTGVPAGTTLTPSGSRTLSTDGQVLSGVDLTGEVIVNADNVTIRNSRLRASSGGSGTRTIELRNGADDFHLIDSEVEGNGSANNATESAVWNHYENPGARLIRSYVHGSPDNWEGRVDLVKDSYMVVDADYPGSHDENIYVCSSSVNVDHSTLVNLHDQTATVFGDTICGGGNSFTVTNSLIAGGGYVFYPQGNQQDHGGGATTITGNRFARCLSGPCPDVNGVHPQGGYWGLGAHFSNSPTNWRENVWDDDSQPVCANGSPGCGSAHPPPRPPGPGASPPVPADTAARSASSGGGNRGTASAVRCIVPKLRGKRLKAARRRARRADCKIGKVRKLRGASRRGGRVVRQRPRAGRRAPAGTKIAVTLRRRSRRPVSLQRRTKALSNVTSIFE